MDPTEKLVQLAQAGNRQAFGELVGRYEHAAVAVALPIVRDFHHAQDVAQESFVTAFRSLHSLRSPRAFGPWLLASVRRRAQRFAEGKTIAQLDFQLQEVLEEKTHWSDELLEILPHLSELPEQELEVVNLRYSAGSSMAEISASLGRPVGTVTKQLSRAIHRLQQIIREPQS
ncbi:MAG: sigma-70 family RNA polymerase sigma factor [Planctomycetota bacterium]